MSGAGRGAIGVDLGGTNVRAALVRDDGAIIGSLHRPAAWDPATYANLEDSLGVLVSMVEELARAPEAAALALAGIGVGVTGQINRRGEFVGGKGPRAAYHGAVTVRDLLGAAFELPVWVDNDSKAATWGEYLYGAGRGANSVIGLTIGTGIGGGIVLDGRLFHGAMGLAGHLGFMTIDMHGPRDVCGVVGHLERYASGTGMARAAQDALRGGAQSAIRDLVSGQVERVTGETVFTALHQGDSLAQSIVEEAARALGLGIASLIHLFNPDRVIVGGGVAEQGAVFLDPVRRIVREHTLINFDQTPVHAAELGDAAGVIGAAALCWQPSAP